MLLECFIYGKNTKSKLVCIIFSFNNKSFKKKSFKTVVSMPTSTARTWLSWSAEARAAPSAQSHCQMVQVQLYIYIQYRRRLHIT